jgi:hypothetical protein
MSIAEQIFGPDLSQTDRVQRLRVFCAIVGLSAAVLAGAGLRRLLSDGGVHSIAELRFLLAVIVGSVASAVPLLVAATGLGPPRRWAYRVAIVGIRVTFLVSCVVLLILMVEFWLTMPAEASTIGIEIGFALAFLFWAALLALMHSVASDAVIGQAAKKFPGNAA